MTKNWGVIVEKRAKNCISMAKNRINRTKSRWKIVENGLIFFKAVEKRGEITANRRKITKNGGKIVEKEQKSEEEKDKNEEKRPKNEGK